MGIQRDLLKIAERLTGTRIYPAWRAPSRGISPFEDIAASLPKLKIQLVFDVGANVGQSAAMYLSELPRATIYCFEPVNETFKQLKQAVVSPRVQSFQIALGSERRRGKMVHHGAVEMFHLLRDSVPPKDVFLEDVIIETLDTFCAQHRVERINYLKVDTEGSDLDVLKGAEEMLTSHRIDLIQVEAGMNFRNTHHVPFEDFKRFLEPRGYFLFGLYEQVPEWPTNEPHLRRTNLLFVSDRVKG